MLKKLHIYAAMHQLGRFTSGEVAKVAGVGESTIYTVISRLKHGWLDREPVKTGLRGGQPIRFVLTDAGRQGIAEDLGRASDAVRLAPPRTSTEAPLGLRSAIDTLGELAEASDPEVVEMLRVDAVRDLDWAEAEVRGTGYLNDKESLLERISGARADLARLAPEKGSNQVAVLEPSMTERVVGVARAVRDWLLPNALLPAQSRLPQLVSALQTGRHIVICRVGTDKGAGEVAFAAKYALEGALVQAKQVVQDLNVDIHDLQADDLAEFLHKVRELSSFQDNSLFFLAVNSTAGEQIVQAELERMEFFDAGLSGAVLDRGCSERLASFTKGHRFRYEPEASNPKHLGWVAETMTAYSCDQPRSVGSVFAAM